MELMANTQPHASHATCLHRSGRREGEQRRGRRRRCPRRRGHRRRRRGSRVVPRHLRGRIVAPVRAVRQTAALGEEVGQLGGRGRRRGGAPVAALTVGRHGNGRLLK